MSLTTPIEWRAVQNAIANWIDSVTGLQAIWQGQATPPSPPYARLTLAGPTVVGSDYLGHDADMSRPSGEEVIVTATGVRQIALTCQVLVRAESIADPDANPRHFLTIVQSSLSLPSVLSDLRAAGLTFVRDDGVEAPASVSTTDWQASIRIVFELRSRLVESTGFIDGVEISSTGLGRGGLSREHYEVGP